MWFNKLTLIDLIDRSYLYSSDNMKSNWDEIKYFFKILLFLSILYYYYTTQNHWYNKKSFRGMYFYGPKKKLSKNVFFLQKVSENRMSFSSFIGGTNFK